VLTDADALELMEDVCLAEERLAAGERIAHADAEARVPKGLGPCRWSAVERVEETARHIAQDDLIAAAPVERDPIIVAGRKRPRHTNSHPLEVADLLIDFASAVRYGRGVPDPLCGRRAYGYRHPQRRTEAIYSAAKRLFPRTFEIRDPGSRKPALSVSIRHKRAFSPVALSHGFSLPFPSDDELIRIF
jgi:hypothetical protein